MGLYKSYPLLNTYEVLGGSSYHMYPKWEYVQTYESFLDFSQEEVQARTQMLLTWPLMTVYWK